MKYIRNLYVCQGDNDPNIDQKKWTKKRWFVWKAIEHRNQTPNTDSMGFWALSDRTIDRMYKELKDEFLGFDPGRMPDEIKGKISGTKVRLRSYFFGFLIIFILTCSMGCEKELDYIQDLKLTRHDLKNFPKPEEFSFYTPPIQWLGGSEFTGIEFGLHPSGTVVWRKKK